MMTFLFFVEIKVFMYLLSSAALYVVRFFAPRPVFPVTPGKLAGPFQGFLFHLQNKTDGILSVRFIWWR